MQNSNNPLTPEALCMLQTIAATGSFAAAARELGVVPSALTYRVRQMEDALDVLLFDRSSRQARPTAAGKELLAEGTKLLEEMDAIANRVRRVATGWEAQLTIAVDTVISRAAIMELCEAFLAENPPTRLRLRDEALSGTAAVLDNGLADLAIGVPDVAIMLSPDLHHHPIGNLTFVFVVAPHHPLAQAAEPIAPADIARYRIITVADSIPRGDGVTIGVGWAQVSSRSPWRDRISRRVGSSKRRWRSRSARRNRATRGARAPASPDGHCSGGWTGSRNPRRARHY